MRTGYEIVLPHRTSSEFAHAAKEDGRVTDINHKLNLMTIVYKSGVKDVVKFGAREGEVGGIHLHHNVVLNVKLNDNVKKGDIVAYHEGFFKPDPRSKQVNMTHGVFAWTAFVESDDTIEDSSAISQQLADRLTIKATEVRTLKLTNRTVIHDIVKIGDKVDINTKLCTIEDEEISELAKSMGSENLIEDLNIKQPKAKHAGYISEINVLYACEIDEMTSTMANFVRKIVAEKKQKHHYAKQNGKERMFPLPTKVAAGTKYKGVDIDDNSVVVIVYISDNVPMDVGSKVVVGSQLKSILAKIYPEPLKTKSGRKIDALFSSKGVLSRIVMSAFVTGKVNASLEDAENNIINMYFNE